PVTLHAYVTLPSASLLPVPLSATVAPSLTFWLPPAFADGPWFVTLTCVMDVAVALSPSVTVSENVSVPAVFGAVKLGVAVSAPVKLTDVPPVCVHAYVSAPSASKLAEPLSATLAPSRTVWLPPALATGKRLITVTWLVDDDVAPSPSVTV